MKISHKVILGIAGMILWMGVVGYTAINGYNVIENSHTEVIGREKARQDFVNARNAVWMVTGFAFLFTAGVGFFIVNNIKHLAAETAELKKVEREFTEARETLEQQAWGIRKTDEAIKALYKDLEQEKARADIASKAKSDFVGNMSHELRTPLNAIIGFSQALWDELFGPLNEKQKEYTGYVIESGKHLLSLINDVLDISKIEAGKMELNLGDFDLTRIVEDSISAIREKTTRPSIQISQMVEEGIGVIRADERKVKQILLNLLSNAAKFTPKGGKIKVEAKKTSNHEVLISVSDTGIGIEEKDRDKVFEEFKQIDSSLTRQYSGTGLGMPLAKKFVELHGGTLWFESEGKDKGACFYFTLPLNGLADKPT